MIQLKLAGIAGRTTSSFIINSYATGQISASKGVIGGVVGYVGSSNYLENNVFDFEKAGTTASFGTNDDTKGVAIGNQGYMASSLNDSSLFVNMDWDSGIWNFEAGKPPVHKEYLYENAPLEEENPSLPSQPASGDITIESNNGGNFDILTGLNGASILTGGVGGLKEDMVIAGQAGSYTIDQNGKKLIYPNN